MPTPTNQIEVVKSPQPRWSFKASPGIFTSISRLYYGKLSPKKPGIALDALKDAADNIPSDCTGMLLSEWMMHVGPDSYTDINELLQQMRKNKYNEPLMLTGSDYVELFGHNAISDIAEIEPPHGSAILDGHTLGPLNQEELEKFYSKYIILGPNQQFTQDNLKGVDLTQFAQLDLEEYIRTNMPNIVMIRPIGSGHFSQAYLATNEIEPPQEIVIQGPKRKKDSKLLAEQFKQAKSSLQELKRRKAINIVQLAQDVSGPEDIIVTQYIKGGTLDTRIPQLTSLERLQTCHSIATTLAVDLHANGFVHRDIKAENFFGKENVLGDFAESREIARKGTLGFGKVLSSLDGKKDWQDLAHVMFSTLSGGKLLPFYPASEIASAIRFNSTEILDAFPSNQRPEVSQLLTYIEDIAQGNMFHLPNLLNLLHVPLERNDIKILEEATSVDLSVLSNDLYLMENIFNSKNLNSDPFSDKFVFPVLEIAKALLTKEDVSPRDIQILSMLSGRQEAAVNDQTHKIPLLSIDEIYTAFRRVFGDNNAHPEIRNLFFSIGTDGMSESLKELLNIIFQYKYDSAEIPSSQRKERSIKIIKAIEKEYQPKKKNNN